MAVRLVDWAGGVVASFGDGSTLTP
jgi:hypothetical protein